MKRSISPSSFAPMTEFARRVSNLIKDHPPMPTVSLANHDVRAFSTTPSRNLQRTSFNQSNGFSKTRENSLPISPRTSVKNPPPTDQSTNLTHLNSSSEVHMVSIASKIPTHRSATAICHVEFSKPDTLDAIQTNSLRKGDVLSVARIAGITAVKRTSDFIPLCHSGLAIEAVNVQVDPVDPRSDAYVKSEDLVGSVPFEMMLERQMQKKIGAHGGVRLACTVECFGKTGVEMEALAGVMGAALTVVDMCKAVDKNLCVRTARIVFKDGGRSGRFLAKSWD